MTADLGPLTWDTLIRVWCPDLPTAAMITFVAATYVWCRRRAGERSVPPVQAACFGVGVVLWGLVTLSAIGGYADVLFWVCALQVLLLLYVVPFFLAQGRPVTVLRDAVGCQRIDRLTARRGA
ncbi:cytochrome c oxidase assembly protein [Mycobacterium tilburgii]|uniref:cytochrome c oxidase assembly protein n=1 Tax=Mycobacterium tilburgii TaxID=44467 RepID=UPI0021B42DD2|nr:cytochrome c oxidase assembly protein [Mycobacterium tilburgii]